MQVYALGNPFGLDHSLTQVGLQVWRMHSIRWCGCGVVLQYLHTCTGLPGLAFQQLQFVRAQAKRVQHRTGRSQNLDVQETLLEMATMCYGDVCAVCCH